MKRLFMNEDGSPRIGMLVGILVGVTVSLLVVISVISEFYQVVEPAHKGLVIKGGELQQNVLNNGFYTKMPYWTDIEQVYVGTLSTDSDEKGKYTEENPFRNIQPLSKDGQVLEVDGQINYAVVDPIKFRTTAGSTDPRAIEQLLLVPTFRKIVYDYASEYGWKSLIQEGERQEFNERIFQAMATGKVTKRVCDKEQKKIDEKTGTEIVVAAGCRLEEKEIISQPTDYGVAISAVNLKRIQPNKTIIDAVEKAQAKEQEVKVAAQQAEIAKQVANEAIEKKRGETESQKLESEANGYKLRVEKEEEAKGIKALAQAEKERAEALKASQQLVEYKKLEIEMKLAEAQVEFAKHYTGQTPESVQIIGTDEAKNMSIFYGMPNIAVNPQK